jgi:translation elongation factor P/translation initiation factor 5A
MHIELDGNVWRILEFQHVKPGKGGAFVRSRLRNLDSGAVVDKTFRAGEKFPRVHTEVKEVQYLYDAGDEVVFMDTGSYEQFSLPHATVEDALPYLEPSSTVQVLAVDGRPAGVQLPSSVQRDQARHAQDGRGRPGAAVRERGRPDQGRPARGPLHLARVAGARPAQGTVAQASCRLPAESSAARRRDGVGAAAASGHSACSRSEGSSRSGSRTGR